MQVTREPNRWDRVAYVVRGDGVTSSLAAAALMGFGAGLLDASDKTIPLWVYVVVWPALTIGVLVFRRRKTRMVLAQWLFRRPKPGSPELVAAPDAPTPFVQARSRSRRTWVDVTSTPDSFYRSGFASMRQVDVSPLIVTPSNPRDVSRPGDLTQPLFVQNWDGRPVSVSFGKLLPRFQLIRNLPQSNDSNHAFASRDVCYLPELGAELLLLGAPASPLARPEHCVDVGLLAGHDLVILSGPDTNFWHAALFEGVARRFENPESSVPLGAGLRDVSSAGIPVYGSSDLFVRVRHAAEGLGRSSDDRGVVRLPEALGPTYGFILLATNPLSDPRHPRWCVFVAGLRSLGTMAASLVLTSMLRAFRTGEIGGDVWSAVPVIDGPEGACARGAVLLVRASVVEAAATSEEHRTRREIPHDRPDPHYRDSYVVVESEILDTTGDHPSWRAVSLSHFGSDVAAWTA